ncbi:hypothetical protein FNH13_03545 [Ornithinimicrobium ciconiae]|uniref:Uncharacterized protein n=1 Tax=Ornithinimicrobium ciconiae TaxID=2594265 RepID=A0A516G7L8_9MICO|nr:hypothetical protein [Ornithinimicrobium ciconiae]QDO87524.1 hypothetical protein FNH13_03545 [Ornithinimicrobium ciconiae]
MSRTTAALAAVVLVLAAGCAGADDPDTAGSEAVSDSAVVTTAPADGSETGLSAYGLALLATPAEATHLTVTDFDAIRARLGVPDLTSADIMTDRLEFWRSAETSSVLLTDGLLREENSRYDLTYDFTQDDVDAEARWSGPDGGGFLLALRPDLDLDLVQAAIEDGAPGLGGASLDRATSTVLEGAGTEGVWASGSATALTEVGDVPAESLIVRNGCAPFAAALGVDATIEDQERVLSAHDVEGLLDVEAVAIAFTGMSATVRLGYPGGTETVAIEEDLAARLALAQDWPTTESIGFSDGFGSGSVTGADGTVGELEYAVTNPGAAANLALADLVPLGVCSDVDPLEEPTGL